MKKVLLVLISLLLLTGCKAKIKEIDYETLSKKLKEEETFVLYLGSSDCSHCASFRPTLEKVIADYKLEVYYIDLYLVTDSQYAAIKKKTGLTGTPTIIYVKEGKCKLADRLVGEQTEESTIEFFKEIGKIKKEK